MMRNRGIWRGFDGTQKPPAGWVVDTTHPRAVGLVSLWGFLEGSGSRVADYGERGYHGTLGAATAAPAWGPGRDGPVLMFDGTNDVIQTTLPFDGTFSGRLPFTVAAIARHTGSVSVKPVLANQTTGSRILEVHTRNGGAGWAIQRGLDTLTDGAGFSSADPVRHLCATYDGTNVLMYRDGRLTFSGTSVEVLNTADLGAELIQLGGNTVAGTYFPGPIARVAIWSRALGPDDVAEDAAEPWGLFRPPATRRTVVVRDRGAGGGGPFPFHSRRAMAGGMIGMGAGTQG